MAGTSRSEADACTKGVRLARASARALGAKRRAEVFETPATLADLQFVESLGPDLSIRVLHAGEGTLWTDLKGSSLALPSSSSPKQGK